MISGVVAMLSLLGTPLDWSAVREAPAPRGAALLSGGRIMLPGRGPGPGARLVAFVTDDQGKTWTQTGQIASDPDERTDLGDGNIVRNAKGDLFAVYRHNHHGPGHAEPDFAVEVATSRDQGKTWAPHSVVAVSRPIGPGPSRGLWSPYLFLTQQGELQCYFDDEDTPFRSGFPGHQWLSMRRFDARTGDWGPLITVSKAHDPAHLSRDGMGSVVQIGPQHLLCAFESVQTEPPHAGLVRFVESEDGGQTWSWKRRERGVLYQPKDQRFHAFSPSLAVTPSGLLALVATNEDRSDPGRSGTPARDLNLDIKYLMSPDGGRTWPTTASLLYGGTHRNYLPGLVMDGNRVFATFLDFDRGCLSSVANISLPQR